MTIASDRLPFQEECFMLVPPDTYGIYGLWSSAELIYYGAATPVDGNIRDWLRAHKKEEDRAIKRCPYHPAYFQWEPNPDPNKRRKELLAIYRESHNGELPLCNR